jgi:hypothetical protein
MKAIATSTFLFLAANLAAIMPWSAGRSMLLKWRPSLWSNQDAARLPASTREMSNVKWSGTVVEQTFCRYVSSWCKSGRHRTISAWKLASCPCQSASRTWLHPSVSGYQHLIVDPCNDPTLPYRYSVQCPMSRMAPFP